MPSMSLPISRCLKAITTTLTLEKGVEATVRYSDYDDLFEDDECNVVQEPLKEE